MKRERALESVKAFLSTDKEIENIIQLCDLHPIKDSWRKWTDHLGNYIQIQNNKRVISFIHSPIHKSEQIVTDVFFKAYPQKISSISKWAFVSFGKNSKDEFNICFIWFLGHDNRLRLVAAKDDQWMRNYPPLVSGIDTLRPIIKNIDVEDYRKADILRIIGPLAANMTHSWSTQWPPSDAFKSEIKNFSDELSNKVLEII
jgi:hypothetical protein